MSVIRPRPPTDPIGHVVSGEVCGGTGTASGPRWRGVLERLDDVRRRMPAASPVSRVLADYGTLGVRSDRRRSALHATLEAARRVRDEVDLVVVVADAPARAVTDLLLSTCCHPFHDLLPRAERGGRPRMIALGPDDDDDRVQGALDVAASGPGDRLGDSWAIVLAGPCGGARARACGALLASAGGRARFASASGIPGPAAMIVAAGADAPGPEEDPRFVRVALPGDGDGAGAAEFAALLPAAIAGIDVVRLLEGAAAMERRFVEAPGDCNPVLGCAAAALVAAASLSAPPRARRRFAAPSGWRGLERWHESLSPDDGHGTGGWFFTTAVEVRGCRRSPFAAANPGPPTERTSPAIDRIDLPRTDEHAVGQLLALLRLSAAVEAEARRDGPGV